MPGTHDLRAAICDDLERRKGVRYAPEQVLCGNGGKQGLLQVMLNTARLCVYVSM